MKQVLPLFSMVLVLSVADVAAEDKRQLDAHQHGHGTLNLAIEGRTLHMELEAPGADIVGFEHAAETQAQKAGVEAGKEKLASPLTLFTLPDEAGCKVASAKVMLEGEGAHDDKEHEHRGSHAGHKEHQEEGAHSEFHAEYKLTCANMDAITTIRFPYFDAFPNSEELDVTLITKKGQKAFEVSRDNPIIDIRGMM